MHVSRVRPNALKHDQYTLTMTIYTYRNSTENLFKTFENYQKLKLRTSWKMRRNNLWLQCIPEVRRATLIKYGHVEHTEFDSQRILLKSFP
jgi:hypothetical protein